MSTPLNSPSDRVRVIRQDGRVQEGQVAIVDYADDAFYLLEPHVPGRIGHKDGERIAWKDCRIVQRQRADGTWDTRNELDTWRRAAPTYKQAEHRR